MKKENTLQAFILTATLFLNSGCFFGYFDSPNVEVKKTTQNDYKTVEPITEQASIITPLSTSVSIECTDDINSPCQKPPISPKSLKAPNMSKQGEIHKLRSIQGKKVLIVERKTGFIFPQHKNKVVILQMFGKNCSHCIKEMPIMGKLYRKYRNKLEIIAVQVEDKMSPREAKRLLRKYHIQYPVIPGDDATNLQYNVQSTYGWTGVLPYTLVIKDGVTEFTYPGEVSYNEINKDIRSILP
jgi:thiol-disulfide isomerase/thioredoxin